MCRSETPLVGTTILQHYSRELQGICAEQAHPAGGLGRTTPQRCSRRHPKQAGLPHRCQ